MKEELVTIGSLTAPKAAKLARDMWTARGLGKAAERLVYYALEKDKGCADGMMLLARRSDNFDQIPQAAAVSLIEYALNTVSDEQQKDKIASEWRRHLFRLGLLVDGTGNRATDRSLLSDNPSELKLDRGAYESYLAKELAPGRSGEAAFDAAHIQLGVQCGLVRHKQLGEKLTLAQFEEYYHPERFEKTQMYSEFLNETELAVEKEEDE